jgi:hypothetical protein
MAFDLVQYFNDQIKIQKPSLLKKYDSNLRNQYIQEINTLVLGKLVYLWREDASKQFQEAQQLDQLYVDQISHSLTTSVNNESALSRFELESAISDILNLQLIELKQLENTGNLGIQGLKELILGQIEHLSGQADDWVWSTNMLTELKGSKPIVQDEISLDTTMKEFNQMVQQHSHDDDVQQLNDNVQNIPTWAKVLEPIVALVILWILFQAVCNIFA